MGSLYAGNLHPDCTEATLYQKFSQFGKIINIHICRDDTTGQSLGYGFVNFETKTEAKKALSSLNYVIIQGRTIRLTWAEKNVKKPNPSANLFIKNIDLNIDEKLLYDVFSVYGYILSLKIMMDDSGHSKGYGFVQFEEEEEANEALRHINGRVLAGRAVQVSKYVPKDEKTDDFVNIFVRNFGPELKDEDLKELCGKFGSIMSAKVMTDENGVSKEYGFVCFKDSDSAKKAVEELNGTELNSRKLYVDRAKKKAERQLPD